jgi:hypothetical protein
VRTGVQHAASTPMPVYVPATAGHVLLCPPLARTTRGPRCHFSSVHVPHASGLWIGMHSNLFVTLPMRDTLRPAYGTPKCPACRPYHDEQEGRAQGEVRHACCSLDGGMLVACQARPPSVPPGTPPARRYSRPATPSRQIHACVTVAPPGRCSLRLVRYSRRRPYAAVALCSPTRRPGRAAREHSRGSGARPDHSGRGPARPARWADADPPTALPRPAA